MAENPADASASLLGYVYQIDLALVLCLEEGPENPTATLQLEVFDDISFDVDGAPTMLAQAKYHADKSAALSDVASDVWSTLAVWMRSEKQHATNARKLLLTTQKLKKDSALSYLQSSGRDEKKALEILEKAVDKSKNEATTAARLAWLELSESDKLAILANLTVIGEGPGFDDLTARMRKSLIYALPSENSVRFVSELRGIWHSIVLNMLRKNRLGVSFIEMQRIVTDLRDRYGAAKLVTTVPKINTEAHSGVVADHNQMPFVHQMRWIGAPVRQLEQAMIDFYRATRQKADWVEDNLVAYLEVEDFAERLRGEWQSHFDWALAEMLPGIATTEKQEIGRKLFQAVVVSATARIRHEYSDPFFTRGTFHGLANTGDVGWHPDFEAKMSEVLGVSA